MMSWYRQARRPVRLEITSQNPVAPPGAIAIGAGAGLNPSLSEAMKIAVRETIGFITQRFPKLTREEAYMIASVAIDYHVTQVVDGTKGIHGMIPKAIFAGQ